MTFFWNTVLTSVVTLLVAGVPIVLLWLKTRSEYKALLIKIRADYKAQLEKQPTDNFNNIMAARKMISEDLLLERKELRLENKDLEEEVFRLKTAQGEAANILVSHENRIAAISRSHKSLFKNFKTAIGMKTIVDVANSKILVLEDDPDDTKLLKRLFDANKVENIEYYSDHDKFFNAIDSNSRILIIDQKLNGGVTGIDIINKVKAINDNRYFIMLSGVEDFELVYKFNRTVTHGIFLIKGRPDTNEILVKSINENMYYLKLLSDTYNEIEN